MRQLSVQELFDGKCYMQTQVWVFFLYFPPKYPYNFIHSDKKSRKFITRPPVIIALLWNQKFDFTWIFSNSLLLIKNQEYVLIKIPVIYCIHTCITILVFHNVHLPQVPSSYLPPHSWPLVNPLRDRTSRDRGPPTTRRQARGTTLPSHPRDTVGTRCRILQSGAGHLENPNLDMILLDKWVV